MKLLLSLILACTLVLSVSSCAEIRYQLPREFHYTEDGKICRERDGKIFDTIWEFELMYELNTWDWGYGDKHYMKESMIEYVPDVDYDVEPFDDMTPVGISAVAEDGTLTWTRYKLPKGWRYMDEENNDLRVVSPDGEVYSSIWDDACMSALYRADHRYGHEPAMMELLIADETSARYRLPEGWRYVNEVENDLRVVSPDGTVYDNIWVTECRIELREADSRYGEDWSMRELRIPYGEAGEYGTADIGTWNFAVVGGAVAAAALAVAVVLFLLRRKTIKI